MNIEESTDYKAIHSILTAPGVFEEIGGSGDPDDFVVTHDPVYLLGRVDGVPMGVFILHGDRDSMECHVQVLPAYREAYAVEFGARVVVMARDYTRELKAEIPNLYPNVQRFAVGNGFKLTVDDGSSRWYARAL